LRTKRVYLAVLLLLPLCASAGDKEAPGAQAPAAVPIASEQHHHLSLQNDYVKVYKVEVAPHESTLLHQHDHDYVYIVIGGAQITSAVPEKPEVHLKLADGEVRFSRGGFAHVARNDGDAPFRNVTIELLRPQGKLRNLCLQVIADKPAACPVTQETPAGAATHTDWPQFETPETRVILTRVRPLQKVSLHDPQREELIVALDEAVLAFAVGKGPERLLRPGDYVWLGRGSVTRVFKNNSDKETRFITLEMKPQGPEKSAPAPAAGPIVGAPLVPRDPDTLIALEHKWMNARDRQTLEEIWADDYEDASENGRFTKQQMLSRPVPPPPTEGAQPPWTASLEDIHVRFYDTIGIVTGRVERRDNSGKIILRTQFTDIFHWESGRWRAVSSQETPVSRDKVTGH
jgi:quercetin dioxygenase-like cupin family protein